MKKSVNGSIVRTYSCVVTNQSTIFHIFMANYYRSSFSSTNVHLKGVISVEYCIMIRHGSIAFCQFQLHPIPFGQFHQFQIFQF